MQCFTATLQRTSAADGTEVYSLKCTAHRICSGRRFSFSHLLRYNVTQDGSLQKSGLTINGTGQLRTAPAPYPTVVIVLDNVFDVLKYLARVWRHFPGTVLLGLQLNKQET